MSQSFTQSNNDFVILTVDSDITNEELEILKDFYPNSEIIIQPKGEENENRNNRL